MAVINGTFLPNILIGTSDDDIINGFGGSDTISGGDGNDVIDGGDGDDILFGGDGDDILIGGTGAATVLSLYNGGNGNDLMIASVLGIAEDFDGGDGIDTVSFAARTEGVTTFLSVTGIPLLDTLRNVENVIGSAFDDEISGDASNNVLRGGAGNDTLDGGDGDDALAGDAGNDTMTGGLGNDTYYVDAAGDTVTELAGEGNDRIATSASYTLAAGLSVETMEVEDSATTGAVNLTGNEIANRLVGNAGANVLDGGAGNDALIGLGGDDLYFVDGVGDTVEEAVGGGNDRILTSVNYALAAAAEVETLEVTDAATTGALNLFGNDFANKLTGNAGNNVLVGGGGNDLMTGLGGNDTYYVDAAGDQVVEAAGGGNDRVAASASFALAANAEVETLDAVNLTATNALDLAGSETANTITGNDGVNILRGEGGDDALFGVGGDDYLVGGIGNDTMYGGAGNDTYYVGEAGDAVVEWSGEGADRVAASGSYALAAGTDVETLEAVNYTAVTALNLTGNGLAQSLVGNAGANMLDGGGGADRLTGGDGADIFAFSTALGAGNADMVSDFVTGSDRIALDDAIFAGIGTPGAFNASAFFTGAAAHDGDDRIIYNGATGQLFYDADGNGAGAAVLFATLQDSPVLTAADFMVI